MSWLRDVRMAGAAVLLWLLAAPAWTQTATPWPEADRLFAPDMAWIGADGGYSIPLPGNRVLWLFGDTLVDPSRRGRLGHNQMVANSLGLQTGLDPSTATIRFLFGRTRTGAPAAWFKKSGRYRVWPGGAIIVGNRVLLFLMRVESARDGLGFRVRGTEPVLIEGLEKEPEQWQVTRMPALDHGRAITLGSAGLVRHEGYIFAYGASEPSGQSVYLARWPESAAMSGRLRQPEWWTAQGWSSEADPLPLLPGAGTEFTVHHDAARRTFIQLQTLGFGDATVAWREAPAPQGPWGAASVLYRPHAAGWWIYQGKAHPWLTGAPLVATYSTNAPNERELASNPARYRPRFLRIDLSAPSPP